jgi:hypothetical protein
MPSENIQGHMERLRGRGTQSSGLDVSRNQSEQLERRAKKVIDTVYAEVNDEAREERVSDALTSLYEHHDTETNMLNNRVQALREIAGERMSEAGSIGRVLELLSQAHASRVQMLENRRMTLSQDTYAYERLSLSARRIGDLQFTLDLYKSKKI